MLFYSKILNILYTNLVTLLNPKLLDTNGRFQGKSFSGADFKMQRLHKPRQHDKLKFFLKHGYHSVALLKIQEQHN